jgi:integrase
MFGTHLAQKRVDMAVIRDLLGHHSVTLMEKYYAHLAPGNLASAASPQKEIYYPNYYPKRFLHHFRARKTVMATCR